ncbi:(Na+)-NQR maturation NqrM [Pokkaliibacter sp. CJK22405]|uniref:(Na+)-NQR maturation NqrM n=1 Tax=Pokkaliibacter sp. CJK22405 TaxID=3384615 RepID=UPI0039846F69
MKVLVLTFVLLLLVVAGMAVGVIMGRKPIKGSCGGMSALGMDTACDICGGNQEVCDAEQQKKALPSPKADLAYDATGK